MPRYEANTPEGRRITSVKLDGVEVLKTAETDGLFIKTADTDEGWVEFYETEVDLDGKRYLKVGPWRDAADAEAKSGLKSFAKDADGEYVQVRPKQVREFIMGRRFGKVEVMLRPAPVRPPLPPPELLKVD